MFPCHFMYLQYNIILIKNSFDDASPQCVLILINFSKAKGCLKKNKIETDLSNTVTKLACNLKLQW